MRRQVQGYDLVGLTAMSFQYQEALALARIVKDSGARTVFGGYHPTLAAEEIGKSDDRQLIDFIVRARARPPSGSWWNLNWRERSQMMSWASLTMTRGAGHDS